MRNARQRRLNLPCEAAGGSSVSTPGLGPLEVALISILGTFIVDTGGLPKIGGAIGKRIREFHESQSFARARTAPKPLVVSASPLRPCPRPMRLGFHPSSHSG